MNTGAFLGSFLGAIFGFAIAVAVIMLSRAVGRRMKNKNMSNPYDEGDDFKPNQKGDA